MESLLSSDSKELQEKIKSLQHENNCLYADLDRRENEIIKLRTAGGKIAFPLNSFAKYFMQVCLFRHSHSHLGKTNEIAEKRDCNEYFSKT